MTQQANILVVEDRADWRAIVCETISERGHRPYSTSSYEEALAALQSQQFDLAIIDPVLDRSNPFNRAGVSIIQKICDMQSCLPVIVVTGSFTPDIKASLDTICPKAPVFFKETWNPMEFSQVIQQQLTDEEPVTKSVLAPERATANPNSRRSLAVPPADRVFGRPRVLIVENRKDWQDIVANVLEEEGYFWRVARNAEEALLEMERENFHLVILDLKLQANDLPMRSSEGWLLLDHLVEVHRKTKVVIISGRATPGDVADLLTKYPIIGFIEKQRFTRQAISEAVAQATKAPELRIQTFDQFRLWRDGQAIDTWDRPQAETIVKLLLVRRARGGRAVTSDELITRLWPDDNEVKGRKKLLPLISNARATLEPDIEPRDSNFILRSANGYFFDLSGRVTWDLFEFRGHLKRGRQLFQEKQWEAAIAELQKGTDFYVGDFLAEDRYADWAMATRYDIINEFRDLLIYLADANAALGRYPEAIKACEVALHKDPLLESVYRRLMRFHYCNGEKGLAFKVYRDCSKLFEELFEESPTPVTRQLYQAISEDRPIECISAQ
jgi:DNA-binding SARP family transcriptional activator/ActR/RegA family two-component response regulator